MIFESKQIFPEDYTFILKDQAIQVSKPIVFQRRNSKKGRAFEEINANTKLITKSIIIKKIQLSFQKEKSENKIDF